MSQSTGVARRKLAVFRARVSHSRPHTASNPSVSAKALRGRMVAVYLLAVVCFLVLAAIDAQGTPVEPDIQKLAEEAQQPRPMFIPSRVGWNGSEMQHDGASTLDASMSPILAAQRERQLRATLWEIVIPEPSAVLGIAGIILLLRKLRSLREHEAVLERQPQPA